MVNSSHSNGHTLDLQPKSSLKHHTVLYSIIIKQPGSKVLFLGGNSDVKTKTEARDAFRKIRLNPEEDQSGRGCLALKK